MNVLHVISSAGFFGAEKVLVELAKATVRTGATPSVAIICNRYNPHTEIRETLGDTSIPCIVFNCNSQFDLGTILALRSFIKKHGIEIVHSHNYKSNFYAWAATLLLDVKGVTTVHNWIRTDPKLRIYAGIDKVLLRRFDRIAVVSPQLVEEVRTAGIPESKVRLIRNGIDVEGAISNEDTIAVRKSLGIVEGTRIVGTVGRLSEEKGHAFFIEAALSVLKEFPDVRFLLVGDGPLRSRFMAEVKEKGHERSFIFAGTRHDVPILLSLMDIFVLPSLVEGMPMALLEAMAARRPVIATRVGAVPSLLDGQESGMVVEPQNVSALAEAIGTLLRDSPRASRMADTAYEKVKAGYSAGAMAREYMKLYREAVGDAQPPHS